MKAEKKLKLSIEALDNFGVYPEIIKDMLSDLKQLVIEKESEKQQKNISVNKGIIELQDPKDMGY